MRKIVLLGYMGCGKSTIANRLSKTTHIPFVDLDKIIEEKTNLSINQIFEQHLEKSISESWSTMFLLNY